MTTRIFKWYESKDKPLRLGRIKKIGKKMLLTKMASFERKGPCLNLDQFHCYVNAEICY